MSLDLEFDAAQQAIAQTVTRFCAERCGEPVLRAAAERFPVALWQELAALGVLGLATPEGGGGALEVCAALEALGRGAFPGPLAATFLATQVLPEAERRRVASGELLVALGRASLWPWAPLAAVFLEHDGRGLWRVRLREPVERLDTLGGEPWGRAGAQREADLGPARRALALAELARAAYLAASGARLLDAAAEHARTRRQFGRPLGDFQAVAHPLADCAMRLSAAATLARRAAWQLDADADADAAADVASAARAAALARLSAASAALEAAYVAHQTFGAVGVTLEGPAFHLSRRIRQQASVPPGEAWARAQVLGSLDLEGARP